MAGSASSNPTLAAVILAAGHGSRMAGQGPASKVLAPVGGQPLILAPVRAALDAGLSPVIIVVGHAAADVRTALAGHSVTVVETEDITEGMGASLRAGIAAAPKAVAGVAVLLGDMPGITAEHLTRLQEAFAKVGASAIVAPTCGGRRGNPVIWPRALFPDLRRVTGDVGGREILRAHAAEMVAVAMDGCADRGVGVLLDIDTPEDLARWGQGSTETD
ncbi:MAG: nucleotidyltransferase family protein [Rhodospirillaceae bacterium]